QDTGASFAVDDERGWFECTRDGAVAFAGLCQLVATHDAAGTWVWGFETGAPPAMTRIIEELVGRDGALAALGRTPSFRVADATLALRLATWIALRAGVVGAYAVPAGGTNSLFALDIAPAGSEGALWCCACGRTGTREMPLVTSSDDVALC